MKHLRLSQAVAQALAPPQARATAAPTPHMGPGRTTQTGFSLVETVVTFALVTLMGAGIYAAYGPGSVSSTVQAETSYLNDLRRGVDSAYRTRGNFADISVQQGVTANWLPPRLANDGTWGAFTLSPATNKDTNDSWRATYAAVPTDACERLVGHELNHWDVLLVNTVPVTTVPDAITQCGTRPSNTVGLQTYGGKRINPDALPPLTLSPAAPTAPTSPIYSTPITTPPIAVPPASTPTGPVTPPSNPASTPDAPGTYGPPSGGSSNPPAPTYTPCVAPAPSVSCHSCSDLGAYNGTYCTAVDATCSGPYGTISYGSPYTQSYGCTPMCTAPAGITETSNQSAACPAGTLTPAGAGSVSQTRTRPVSYACPAGASTYTTNYGTYTPWTPDTSTACAPKCTAPANTTQTNTVTGSCPGGQVMSNGANTFSQSQTRSVTYSCPAPTGSYTTAYGAYGALSPTAAQVGCAPICTPPPRTYTSTGCPAGQLGTISYYADGGCTAPNGTAYYGGWVAYSNTCAPVCVAPAPASVYAGQQYSPVYNGSCPSGQSGTYQYKYLQNVYNNYTYSCPAPTGGYATNYTGQSTTNVSTVVVTNTCKTTCVAIDAFVLVRRDGIELVMLAQNVREGDELCVMNPGTGAKRWGEVTYSKTTPADSVRFRTESGIELTCSRTAPIGLKNGGQVLAADLLDQVIATEDSGIYGGSRVMRVMEVGEILVQHITCENDFFLAGDAEGRYVAHHNKKPGVPQCVAPEAFVRVRREGVEQDLTASELRLGDMLRVFNPETQQLSWGPLVYAKTVSTAMVRVTTVSGVVLDCSVDAPIRLSDGTYKVASDLFGEVIAAEQDGVFGLSEVLKVRELDTTLACHLHCDGGSFLVGNRIGSYLIHE